MTLLSSYAVPVAGPTLTLFLASRPLLPPLLLRRLCLSSNVLAVLDAHAADALIAAITTPVVFSIRPTRACLVSSTTTIHRVLARVAPVVAPSLLTHVPLASPLHWCARSTRLKVHVSIMDRDLGMLLLNVVTPPSAVVAGARPSLVCLLSPPPLVPLIPSFDEPCERRSPFLSLLRPRQCL